MEVTFYSPKVAELSKLGPWESVQAFFGFRTYGAARPGFRHAAYRAMGAGLFEVRAKGREGIGRAFYCSLIGERIVILHVIIKKTEKTPARELEIARARQREVKA